MPQKLNYDELLDQLQEMLPYIVQRKEPGEIEWKNLEQSIRGKAPAFDRMVEIQEEPGNEKAQFRVLPKNEADKYREGLAVGRLLGPEEEESRERRPLMVMPERL